MFITYILYSVQLDKFYIGYTGQDMQLRLLKHLSDHGGFTGRAKDWEIVHQEFFNTKQEAMQREKQIKGWKSNKKIKALIGNS
jgi:putative endonuclease